MKFGRSSVEHQQYQQQQTCAIFWNFRKICANAFVPKEFSNERKERKKNRLTGKPTAIYEKDPRDKTR